MDKQFYKKLIRVALPIAIQSLITNSLNMLDVVIMGSLGENQVAAVGIANQFFFILSLIFFGVSGGCSVYLSQFWGKKDTSNIKKIVGMGVVTVIGIGAAFLLVALLFPNQLVRIFTRDEEVMALSVRFLRIICFSYILTGITVVLSSSLRCTEKAVAPMIVSFIAVIINGLLNYILVFGKLGLNPLGVSGSAVATDIARVIELGLILFFVLNQKSNLRGKVSDFFKFDFAHYKNVIKDIIPVVANEGCWAIAVVAYTAAYGLIGTSAIASMQICSNVQNLFMVITFGVANGCLVVIGNEIGAGKEKRAREYAKKFFYISLVIGVGLGITMTVSAPYIMKLFKVSNGVVKDSITILKIMSIVAPIKVYNIVAIVGILRGGGDTKTALYIEASTMWFIGVPLAFLGAYFLKLPITVVMILISMEEVVKYILSLIRVKSGKWIRNVTESA